MYIKNNFDVHHSLVSCTSNFHIVVVRWSG